ncbi:MAG: DUF4244 domain-containing protein [Micrococcales bacterium]|nr:DUF4244 domain-containing protein [Micrococcales bacterium]
MRPLRNLDERVWIAWRDQAGGVTAEYAIAILAAAGFAGLLLAILQSQAVRGWLTSIVERALSL